MVTRVFTIVFIVFFSNTAFAGTMRDWVESVYLQIDTPLIDTLEIYRTDGFILIDVGANYGAYSYTAERLTLEQRQNPTTVEGDAGLVIRYESCPPQSGWLNGRINHASVAMKVTDASSLAEEMRELLLFAEQNEFQAWGFGPSKERDDQSYFGWNDINGNSIEMQINQFTHQIKFQILRQC